MQLKIRLALTSHVNNAWRRPYKIWLLCTNIRVLYFDLVFEQRVSMWHSTTESNVTLTSFNSTIQTLISDTPRHHRSDVCRAFLDKTSYCIDLLVYRSWHFLLFCFTWTREALFIILTSFANINVKTVNWITKGKSLLLEKKTF